MLRYFYAHLVSILIIASALSFSAPNASAQKKAAFSDDPEQFIKELADFMAASKKEGKKFVEDEFGPLFLAGAITPQMKKVTIDACSKMRELKFKAYPEVESYLKAVMYFPRTRKSEQFFADWTAMIFQIAEDRKTKKLVPDFLASSATLYERNVFFSSGSVEWKLSNANYTFSFDSIPMLVFPSGNLIGYAKGDSTRILNTSGAYHFSTERWIGGAGKVQWDRAEFSPETTYATFEKYEVRIKGSNYIVDSVLFYNEYFDTPLLGQLSEKVLADKSQEDASYPRFESYDKRLQIKNLFDKVDFDGGFTMRGSKLAGSGTTDELSVMSFYREGKPFLKVQALEFIIRPDRISSDHVSVNFTFDEDSIYHPDVTLRFDAKSRELVLIRPEEGFSKAPFINTYHGVDMSFEALYWKIDNPMIEMGSLLGSTQHNAVFESRTFYKAQRYDAMMGFSTIHPLIEIRNFMRQTGQSEFTMREFMGFLRMDVEQTMVHVITLANGGFLTYDQNTEEIKVNDKLIHYVENSAGKRDYDVLQFNSSTGGAKNARLSLLDNNLLLRGVQRIQLSDSQNVNILPSNEEVLLKKNRDFEFGGRVYAGNFEFIGREYFFNYEEFKIDLITVDSCRIYVEDESTAKDMYGRRQTMRVRNVLEEIAGEIRIDSPTNKSGTQSAVYPQYPILISEKNSFVYYDNSKIQRGAYERDDFFYRVEPFVIDSLDNFTREQLKFDGTLVSGGIFPDITEPLRLMDDNALGFKVNTGAGGLPLYKGKGKFTNEITLDYNGLQGGGDLSYLTSLASADQFIFLPKQTFGRTSAFVNQERRGKPEVPKVQGGEVDVVFDPQADFLTATSVKTPITFFNDEAFLTGALKLKPTGMTGDGEMAFDGATLGSQIFDYGARTISADTADFKLAEVDLENLAFRTTDVKAHIDFDKRMGEFKSNGGETKIEFPANMYVCYMDQFKWFMDKNELELTSSRKATDDFVIDTAEDQARSNFFSVNELQDSLNFLSPTAIYDVKNTLITCQKIKYITVADSRVLPDSGKVLIRRRAKMDPLNRATVISNYVTQYHRIFNADLEIMGRKNYEGKGQYTYVDENKREQVIQIENFKLDSTYQTVARGIIREEDAFALSSFFDFQGNFKLFANEQHLTFEGGTRLIHICDNFERNWFKFTASIDPMEIFIPVDTNMRDIGMAKLGAGVLMSNSAPLDLYGSFLSRKVDRNDLPLIEPNGFLFFDKLSRTYKIGSKEKIRQPKLPGNLLALNVDDCNINGDGKINYHVDLGMIKLGSVGEISHESASKISRVNGVLSVDFFLDESISKYLSDQLEQWPGLQPLDISKTMYERSIREAVGLEESDKIISELALNGQFKRLPEQMQSTLYFADVKFEWDPVEESFVSVGALGIASVGKKQVFRYVKGKIEIARSRSADVIRIYLHFDDANWLFLDYKLGIMNISTTDKALVTILTELKDEKRRTKDEAGNKFAYQLVASKKKRDDFIDRFREFD
jgi:hypothetical protein